MYMYIREGGRPTRIVIGEPYADLVTHDGGEKIIRARWNMWETVDIEKLLRGLEEKGLIRSDWEPGEIWGVDNEHVIPLTGGPEEVLKFGPDEKILEKVRKHIDKV